MAVVATSGEIPRVPTLRSHSTLVVRSGGEHHHGPARRRRERILDELAAELGGRSAAIRTALRHLAAERARSDALATFLDAWADDAGPVDDHEVDEMARRYRL